jgi:transposase
MGFRAQLLFFLDELIPSLFGKPTTIERVFAEDIFDLPALVRTALRPLVAQLMELRLQIKSIEKELLAWHRTSQESRRLETIPRSGVYYGDDGTA